MKYLKNYNNMELINESRWLELAVMRAEYTRDDEIREFFLELSDIGGRFITVTNATHTITDGDFQVGNRIDYVNKPLYYSYLIRMKFSDVHGSIDDHMEKSCDFFNEFDDALFKLKEFGYKFKIKKFQFDYSSPDGINFDIGIYHTDDIVPWEHIFAPMEK